MLDSTGDRQAEIKHLEQEIEELRGTIKGLQEKLYADQARYAELMSPRTDANPPEVRAEKVTQITADTQSRAVETEQTYMPPPKSMEELMASTDKKTWRVTHAYIYIPAPKPDYCKTADYYYLIPNVQDIGSTYGFYSVEKFFNGGNRDGSVLKHRITEAAIVKVKAGDEPNQLDHLFCKRGNAVFEG